MSAEAHLALEGIRPSIGSVGDAFDNALMETIIGLFKAECIRTTVFHTGPTRPSPTSSTPPPAGSIGTTTAGSTDQSGWSRQPNTSKPTTLPSSPRCSPHESGTKLGRFTTELGRHPSARLAQAIKIRAGTCRHPTCTVPADRCDLDHHQPWPHGPTSATNMDPLCRRHHRAKTFAWLATLRNHNSIDWTMPDAEHYRCIDDPLPTGRAA